MNETITHIFDMNETEINNFVQTHIKIKKTEKDKYGEVFTNPILIDKILDLFPKNLWNNHKLTWLDPACGVGFIIIHIYLRLMKGLKQWEPNNTKRSNHIIENMLFMVELNKQNCIICRKLFGNKANIFCGNFLDHDIFEKNKQQKQQLLFNCIAGNPPFQNNHEPAKNGKRINGGKSKLYELIFLKSHNLLENKGHLAFIVPDNIFAGNGSPSYKTIIENSIPFVSFNPENQKTFQKIQQPVCYFILHKVKPNKHTTIEHDDKLTFKLQLLDRPVNPIRNWTPYTEKLIKKFVSSQRNSAVYNRGKNISNYTGSKFNIIYTKDKLLQSNKKEDAVAHGIKKIVLFSISPDLDFQMDYSGEFGVGPNTFYIPFDNHSKGKKLEKFFTSDEYKILANSTKTSRQFLKIALIEHLKLTKIMETTNSTKKIKQHVRHKNRNTRKKSRNNT